VFVLILFSDLEGGHFVISILINVYSGIILVLLEEDVLVEIFILQISDVFLLIYCHLLELL
jgi:hypothetical protein